MEPLSITASVFTVLHITNKAVGYLVTLSNAPKEIRDLVDELQNTQKGLEDLARLASSVDSDPTAESTLPTLRRVTDLKDESSPLANCYREIEAVNVTLTSGSGSKRDEAIKKLKWLFKDKEVSKVVGKLARLRIELLSALHVDQT